MLDNLDDIFGRYRYLWLVEEVHLELIVFLCQYKLQYGMIH